MLLFLFQVYGCHWFLTFQCKLLLTQTGRDILFVVGAQLITCQSRAHMYYPGRKNQDSHACQTTGACMLERAHACAQVHVVVSIFLARVAFNIKLAEWWIPGTWATSFYLCRISAICSTLHYVVAPCLDPHQLGIRCRLNGESVQDSNTNQLVHKTEALIVFLSK